MEKSFIHQLQKREEFPPLLVEFSFFFGEVSHSPSAVGVAFNGGGMVLLPSLLPPLSLLPCCAFFLFWFFLHPQRNVSSLPLCHLPKLPWFSDKIFSKLDLLFFINPILQCAHLPFSSVSQLPIAICRSSI
jgi:hypothetical protein